MVTLVSRSAPGLGRTWRESDYALRDARLRALGIQHFGRRQSARAK